MQFVIAAESQDEEPIPALAIGERGQKSTSHQNNTNSVGIFGKAWPLPVNEMAAKRYGILDSMCSPLIDKSRAKVCVCVGVECYTIIARSDELSTEIYE